MSKFDKEQRVQAELIETTKVVRAYAESEGSRAIIAMLDALGQSYAMDIVHCTVDQLVQLQSSIKQVYALRNVIANDGMNIPKI
jgi:hypothetical protein